MLMFATTGVLTWVVFGAAAAVLGMLLYRGDSKLGMALNIPAGITGAFAGGAVGRLLGLYPTTASPLGYVAASVGALLFVAGYLVLARWIEQHRPHTVARVRASRRPRLR